MPIKVTDAHVVEEYNRRDAEWSGKRDPALICEDIALHFGLDSSHVRAVMRREWSGAA